MPWLTASETADRYRISVSGLMKQRAEGRPPGSLGKRAGKRVLWASQDLDAFDGYEPDTFGAVDALVLEVRGLNKTLHAILVQMRKPKPDPIINVYVPPRLPPDDGRGRDPEPTPPPTDHTDAPIGGSHE